MVVVSILWNQCTDLNKWFYVDYNEYQFAKDYRYAVNMPSFPEEGSIQDMGDYIIVHF